MGFGAAIGNCLSNYVTFRGRASRSEYWWFALFLVIAAIAANVLDSVLGTYLRFGAPEHPTAIGYIYPLWSLAMLLPTISVAVRRLHDRNHSGWWYWLFLVPVVGGIWLLVWFCRRGTPGPNRFGQDPIPPLPPPAPEVAAPRAG